MGQPDRGREKQIIRLLQQRNKRALVLLYEHYAPALTHIIFRIVKDKEVTEEVLQDTFLKIWKQGSTYDANKGKLFTWIARIAKHTAIDRLRSKQFRSGQKTETLPDYVYNNERFGEHLPLRDPGLQNIIQNLEPKYREIIDTLYFREHTQSEASKALGLPLGTVKSRARMAITKLRELLKKEP